MSDLMLDVGLANQIKMAARRAGATSADLNALTAGNTFERILPVLRGLGEVAVTKRLRPVGVISLPALRKNRDSREFFQNRDGLYVWDEFGDQILPVFSPVKKVPKAKLSVFDLTEPMTDEEIRTELGDGYLFEDASIACAYLKEMLTRQKNGQEGGLLVNGHANILYVRGGIHGVVFVVYVYWYADSRRWDVHAYRLSDGRWGVGRRVLSGNC